MTLADARAAVAQRAQTTSQPAQQAPATLAQQIDRMRPEIARALPKHMDADRMARIALTTLRRTPKLAACTPESFLGALMTCSQLGVEPGATGEAYLVPYGRECTFILGYKGMAKLFWQSPIARSLAAEVVYENDHFEWEKGLEPRLEHRPVLANRGRPVAYYAVATTVNGGSAFVVMSPEDVEQHRKHSRSGNSGPWRDHYDAMAKKTCVRELFKLLPVSVELSQAIAHDESIRTDLDTAVIDVEPEYIPGELVQDGAE
ncbi:recombination protein RecT [Kitasatospora sp. HPMI-4]|uniref:recombination protein RecT n=1 Tax=Kitasatospora sp. HPMI-4 TaxID=3448443 RepID=UPI003F1C53B5